MSAFCNCFFRIPACSYFNRFRAFSAAGEMNKMKEYSSYRCHSSFDTPQCFRCLVKVTIVSMVVWEMCVCVFACVRAGLCVYVYVCYNTNIVRDMMMVLSLGQLCFFCVCEMTVYFLQMR